MKKVLMTLAAVLCCVMAATVFTACEKNENIYSIAVESGGLMTGETAVYWRKTVLSIYQRELGVDGQDFIKHGTAEECDKEVLDACKRAESSLIGINGQGVVTVNNRTTRKIVYRREIQ